MIAWPALDLTLILALGAALVAGMVRGFAGFGTAMIMVPALSALYSPVVAVPVMLIVDLIGTLPLVPPAFRRCAWRTVIPMAVCAGLFVPIGALVLVGVPARPLAVAIGLIVLVVTVVLATGVRYAGKPTRTMDLGVSAVAGLMNGATGMGGPPIVLFWLASQTDARLIRANVIALFTLMSAATFPTMGAIGLFTGQTLGLALVCLPVFVSALLAGSRIFGLADERVFRRVALVVIAGIAAASLASAA